VEFASVLLAVSCLFSTAVAVQPGLDDGEFLLDTCPEYRAATGSQENPAIAFDGENFLLVWQDTRDAYYSDIYGARVTPAGTLLDPTGFPIAVAEKQQEFPVVACAESVFLVVWEDRRNGFYQDIYAARVTLEGVVLDTLGIAISVEAYEQLHPSVAFDGSNFLVVWGDCRTESYDLYGTRVTPAGVVLDPRGFPVSTAVRYQVSPVLAFDGANFLAVWVDTRSGSGADLYGARVTPAGEVLDPDGIPVCTTADGQHDPTVTFGGTDYLVVWQDSAIIAARVTPAGLVLDSSGIVVAGGAGSQLYPTATYDGTNFLVVWYDNRGLGDVYGARITPEGAVLDTSGIRITAGQIVRGQPTAAFDDADFLVAWTYVSVTNTYDIYGARVTPAGMVIDTSGIILSTAANPQTAPAVASDSASFLAVWQDERTPSVSDIYAARASPQGVLLDSQSIAVSTATSQQVSPAVACDGANYLVVWQDARTGNYDIHGARLTSSGALLDSLGFPVSTAPGSQELPAVAFDGTNCLVVWQDTRNGEYDIYGARLATSGVLLDSFGFAVSTAYGPQESPAVVFDGTNFFVVWQDMRSGYPDVYGARVSSSGAVLDTSGIPVSVAEYGQNSPAIAFDGANSFVIWVDERNVRADIYGARVTPAGVVLDSLGIAVTADTNTEYSPAVSFDGVLFLTAWSGSPWGPESDIYGARVTTEGAVLDRFVMVAQDGCQLYPSIASGAGNQMFLVYQGRAGAVGGRSYDTDRIWGKLGPFIGIEESPKPQASSHKLGATVVRGLLRLSEARGELLDISGRSVLALHSGANDVSRLSPGVYFVRSKPSAVSGRPSAVFVRKVVIQ
jgi:hypothetical protein